MKTLLPISEQAFREMAGECILRGDPHMVDAENMRIDLGGAIILEANEKERLSRMGTLRQTDKDGNWTMQVFSVDIERARSRGYYR